MAVRSRFLMVDGGDQGRRYGCESAAYVVAIARSGRLSEKFVDDGQVVAEGADGWQRSGSGIAIMTAGGGQDEGGSDDLKRHAAVMECGGQTAIGGTRATGEIWDGAVELDDAADIGGGGGHWVVGAERFRSAGFWLPPGP